MGALFSQCSKSFEYETFSRLNHLWRIHLDFNILGHFNKPSYEQVMIEYCIFTERQMLIRHS